MGKNKIQHFEENKTFPHFFQPVFEEFKMGYKYKGTWCADYFNNEHPLVLELGCGKGEYTIGLAKEYPDTNFIGIDIKGARMWRGAKTAQLERIRNVAFLRIKIEQLIFCFGHREVDEIWIIFPDPVPKIRRIRKRLTSEKFLDIYSGILKPGGKVHVKTDSRAFYDFALETVAEKRGRVLYQTDDLYRSGYDGDAPTIQTYYERKYLEAGNPICYIQFTFDAIPNAR